MKKTRKPARPVSADAIARLADRGKDVSGFLRAKAGWFSQQWFSRFNG
jgi:hypothetical protein